MSKIPEDVMQVARVTAKDVAALLVKLPYRQMMIVADELSSMVHDAEADGAAYDLTAGSGFAELLTNWSEAALA